MFAAFVSFTRVVNRVFALAARAGVAAIILLVLVQVIVRALGYNLGWPLEIAQFILVYVFFLSLAPALESGHHVRVDIFTILVPPPLRRLIPYVATVLTVGFGIVFFWYLWAYTARAFADNRLSPSMLPIPLKWIYVVGPLGAAQFILTELAAFRSRGVARLESGQHPLAHSLKGH